MKKVTKAPRYKSRATARREEIETEPERARREAYEKTIKPMSY